MRLISLIFSISLFVGFINCTNQSDQNKSALNDKPTVQTESANSNQPAQPQPTGPETLKLESRQINASPHHYNQDAQASNINIYTTNLSPKDTAHLNPNSPLGYIKIQPVLAPLSSHQTPESQGSTTFLSFIKPKHHEVGSSSRRSFSLTNKLKNLMSSLFWKDNSNSNYMTSGSSYSFALKQPPPQFNTMNSFQMPPNYANYEPNLSSSSSQYKQVIFPNYQQASSNNFNKYTSSFNGPQFGNSANGVSSSATYSGPYYPSNQNNAGYGLNPNYMRNNNNNLGERNIYSSSAHTGFPPSSYQVAYQPESQQASSSNNMNSFASPAAGNQYSNNNQQDSNTYTSNNNYNNQRLSAAPENSSSVNSKAVYSPTDSSSSAVVSNYDKNSLPLTNSNPVSLIKTNNKQQF